MELTEALLEKHGEEWLRQHGDVVLEQWEMMLRLGIIEQEGKISNRLPEERLDQGQMNRCGFSWKRLIGISAAKGRLSRSLGVPLTRSGRERKIGRLVTGGGCLVGAIVVVGTVLLFLIALAVAIAQIVPAM
ncbi:MAG: hypothetical protein ABSC55_21760 [Syntrophorhabdales bacterium]